MGLAGYVYYQQDGHPTGALIDVAPLEPQIQGEKYNLSRYGLRYSPPQTFTYAGTSDGAQGDSSLGNYNLDFAARWTMFDAPTAGTADWTSMQMEYRAPLASSSQVRPRNPSAR